MPYITPNFNLTANVWRAGNAVGNPPDLVTDAQLRHTGKLTTPVDARTSYLEPMMALLVPAGTDLRSPYQGWGPDNVEIPAGSGRYYICIGVDDVGKGFTNEHRCGYLMKNTPLWPSPMP